MDILLAWISNLLCVFQIVAFLAGVAFCIVLVPIFIVTMDGYECEKKELNALLKIRNSLLLVLCVSLPISTIPTISDVWRARIGLIKLQLSSPENVKQGSETIERIAEKLEKKYLDKKE